jgi:hypothetical protein
MMRRVMTSVLVASVLATGAFASWNVTVINSSGVLNPPSTPVQVPVQINLNGPYFAPSPTVTVNALPQVSFLTTAGAPNPILVGDGTAFTNGTFSAAYTITPVSGSMLTGFNFVIAGVVDGSAMIVWQKKVVRNSDNAILYNDSGYVRGFGFRRHGWRVQRRDSCHPVNACQRCDRVRELPVVRVAFQPDLHSRTAVGGAGLGA